MALNPVEQRLVQIKDLWDIFASDPDKRLLIWRCQAASYRMMDCFFEAQKHESDYATRDLFLVFKDPFTNAIQYSHDLKTALAGIYAASRDDLKDQGISPDWAFDACDEPDSPAGVMGSLRSFGMGHDPHFEHLVAVLMPTEVSHPDRFAKWVADALASGPPERLRIAVVDSAEAPCLDGIARTGDPRVLQQTPALDIMAIAQETFAQEPASGPAGVFRNLLMGLVALVENGSPAEVDAKARDALQFAERQGWLDQQIAILILLAGSRLKEQRVDEAVELYRMAGGAAVNATAAGHPAGHKLQLQGLFGEAGAQLSAGRMTEAATCYDAAAVVARDSGDLVLLIEASRMGAFCHARMSDTLGAIDRLWAAFDAGERMAPDVRALTTLPVAATELMRLLDPSRAQGMEEIGSRAQADTEAAMAQLEEEAARVAAGPDPRTLPAVLGRHEGRCAAIWQAAEHQLTGVVGGAEAGFRTSFARARSLLGAAWPFADAAVHAAPARAAAP